MSYRLRNKLNLVFIIALVFACFGSGLSMSQMLSQGRQLVPASFYNGFVDGGIIGLLLGGYTHLIAGLLLHRAYHKLPSLVRVLVSTSFYLILIFFGRAVGRTLVSGWDFSLFPGQDEFLLQSVLAAFFGSLLFNFFFEINRILGPGVLWGFFTGRYFRPKEEEHVVMFLDLKASTTIAERLGGRKYIELLDQFFFDMTESLLAHGASVYKYVGDEAILFWPKRKANRNILQFVFDFQAILDRRRDFYQSKFDCIPEFRSGAHLGPLMRGEVGDIKKEIAMLGDTMNTAARIIDVAKRENKLCVISDSVKDAAAAPEGIAYGEIGEVELKGKTKKHRLWSAEAA